jgi:hypothetical protein
MKTDLCRNLKVRGNFKLAHSLGLPKQGVLNVLLYVSIDLEMLAGWNGLQRFKPMSRSNHRFSIAATGR